MKKKTHEIEMADASEALNVCGQNDEHLRMIEKSAGVSIVHRGGRLAVSGPVEAAHGVGRIVEDLRQLHRRKRAIENIDVQYSLMTLEDTLRGGIDDRDEPILVNGRGRPIRPRTENQRVYTRAIAENDFVFGIGPAGTGKTFLAVACAVQRLLEQRVQRIVVCRPAVEAGEKLGFLPGDMQQKVDPYLRPIYDALYSMIPPDRALKLIERGAIEVAPLAFMRGRTLENAFAILDEAQNTTIEQMKMFLTRLGRDSCAVVTGDVTQIDLPADKTSGLIDADERLNGVHGIAFVRFTQRDVVRHDLVRRIIEAYQNGDNSTGEKNGSRKIETVNEERPA